MTTPSISADNTSDPAIFAKMRSAGVAEPTLRAFLNAVAKVRAGDRGMVAETEIEPVDRVPDFATLRAPGSLESLTRQLAVIKLNGGLGTGMGLDRAKSLIPVKGQDNFLDFIARQILHLRGGSARTEPAFYLMDSFSTQADTLNYLAKYADLGGGGPVDFLQNKVPKLDISTLQPVNWPEDPSLEWCPPGHGDIYASLLGCGLMDRMLDRGIRYLFVSNSDNLGATVDGKLLGYFADSDLSFLMEVAQRTASDSKGGHLARRRTGGRLLLRESAQCPKEDETAFQDVERHRYFNTNNLWIRLDRLKEELDRTDGALPLPLITNAKTVDPRRADSPRVWQLESAMGAAIECFDRSGAVLVPRERFSPVKTTADLLALRSDTYVVTADHRLVLDPSRQGEPPLIQLDGKHYKLLVDFEARFAGAPPSLLRCRSLKLTGPVRFEPGVVCEGDVEFLNRGDAPARVPAGVYGDRKIELH